MYFLYAFNSVTVSTSSKGGNILKGEDNPQVRVAGRQYRTVTFFFPENVHVHEVLMYGLRFSGAVSSISWDTRP